MNLSYLLMEHTNLNFNFFKLYDKDWVMGSMWFFFYVSNVNVEQSEFLLLLYSYCEELQTINLILLKWSVKWSVKEVFENIGKDKNIGLVNKIEVNWYFVLLLFATSATCVWVDW